MPWAGAVMGDDKNVQFLLSSPKMSSFFCPVQKCLVLPWAGAVMQKCKKKQSVTDRPTDRRTDGRTDRPTRRLIGRVPATKTYQTTEMKVFGLIKKDQAGNKESTGENVHTDFSCVPSRNNGFLYIFELII